MSVCDLMAVCPDGSSLRMSAGMGLDRSAWPSAFSPDSHRLRLGSNCDKIPTLCVLNLADLSIVTLTQMAETGSWPLDGAMVAFAWNSGLRGYGLEIVGVDGASRRDVATAVRTATGRRFEPTGGSRGPLTAARSPCRTTRTANATPWGLIGRCGFGAWHQRH